MQQQQHRVEWRRAMRQRSYQLAEDSRRQGRMVGEQLKRRLVTEAVATGAELERLRRQRAGMEARLDRYSGEQARLRSQRLLRDIGDSSPAIKEPPQPPQPPLKAEEAPTAPAEKAQRAAGRKLDQDLDDEAAAAAAEEEGGEDEDSDLTDWEAALLAEFVARQRELDADEAKTSSGRPQQQQQLIDGLSLEKFLRRCESRRRMDGAIRRLADFVDRWQPAPEAAATAATADWHFRRRQRQLAKPTQKTAAAATARSLQPTGDTALAAVAVAAATAAAEAAGDQELGRIERDFRSLLQEARKARYLRGRNPEIVERDRELTTEEVFRLA